MPTLWMVSYALIMRKLRTKTDIAQKKQCPVIVHKVTGAGRECMVGMICGLIGFEFGVKQ